MDEIKKASDGISGLLPGLQGSFASQGLLRQKKPPSFSGKKKRREFLASQIWHLKMKEGR